MQTPNPTKKLSKRQYQSWYVVLFLIMIHRLLYYIERERKHAYPDNRAFLLASLLACMKSFASLEFRVVGLFSVPERNLCHEQLGIRKIVSPVTIEKIPAADWVGQIHEFALQIRHMFLAVCRSNWSDLGFVYIRFRSNDVSWLKVHWKTD